MSVLPRPHAPLSPVPAAHATAACSQQRFVCGERFTEADLRLFPTIARFDGVYNILFKCSKRSIRADYPHLEVGAEGRCVALSTWGLVGWCAGMLERRAVDPV